MSKSDPKEMSRSNRKNKQKKSKQPKKKGGIWKKILLGLLGLLLAALVGGFGLFVFYASDAPELTQEDLRGNYASDFVDMNGKVFYKLGGVDREFATSEDYPQVMIDAIMAIEDQRFDSHFGIDPIGIARAAIGYLVEGQIVGGGSTITQQLIKLSVFSTLKEDQTLERKAQEAWLAIQLEQQLSKEQIMTLYLNKIHMGGNVYGAATAAQEYYGKNIKDLELHEAAMFASMPRAPNYYNPYVNVEAATTRRNTVLTVMVEEGMITQAEADAAKEIPVTEGLQEPTEQANTQVFDSYIETVIEEVRAKTGLDPQFAGLTIHTNYDPDAQQLLFDVANTNDYVEFPNDDIQTAMTLVDSATGKITAMIGNRKVEGQKLRNQATESNRSIGSTIKPLTTYGPAIEFLNYSTYHQVYDEKYQLGDWPPSNYDNRFKGQMSMREALVDSRNVPTAKLFNEDLKGHHDEIRVFLESMGIDVANLNPNAKGLVPSNAISANMNTLTLAGAYAAIANQGNYNEPHTATKVVTQEGQEIDLTPETTRVMKDSTAYMLTDMLKGVIPHYGQQLSVPGYVHAAKTGTSNYTADEKKEHNLADGAVPDNLVVGFSPYYTMSVWMGYSEYFKPLTPAEGSTRLARQIYKAVMTQLTSGLERRDWQRPESVVQLQIEDGTDPAELAPPGSSNVVSELFVRGYTPTTTAEPEIPEVELSAPTGLSARYVAASDNVSVNWNAFTLPDGVDTEVQYVLSINGEEQVLTNTEYLLSEPPRGNLNISLAIRVGEETGPVATVTLVVPEQQEEEPEDPEEPDDEGGDTPPDEEEPPVEPEEPEEPEEPGNEGGDTPPDEENPEESDEPTTPEDP